MTHRKTLHFVHCVLCYLINNDPVAGEYQIE